MCNARLVHLPLSLSSFVPLALQQFWCSRMGKIFSKIGNFFYLLPSKAMNHNLE